MAQRTSFENSPSKLTQFEAALKQNNKAAALKLLSLELLDETSIDGNNVMHFAVQYLESIYFQSVCQFVKKNKSSLLMATNFHGETVLHYAIKFCDYVAINYLIKNLDKQASHAAKMMTNKGLLPIDYLHQRSNDDINSIAKLLIPLMQANTLCHPNKKLDIKAILEEYKESCKENSNLADQLRIIVAAMNEMPKVSSATHPNSEEKDKDKLAKEIKLNSLQVREGCHTIHLEKLSKTLFYTFKDVTEDVIDYYRMIDSVRLRAILNFRADFHSKSKKANCDQQADILLKLLHSKSPTIYAEKIQIKNGDHALIAINRDPLKDTTQISKRVIYVDPFARVICLAHDYHIKLQYYLFFECGNISFDLVGPLNLNYHTLTPAWISGVPHSYFSDLTLILMMDDIEKKQFFLARDDKNRTLMHRMADCCEILRCKIFLKIFFDLNDKHFAKNVFAALDIHQDTVLHTSIRRNDVLTVAIFLNEYINIFGNKITEKILQGPQDEYLPLLKMSKKKTSPVSQHLFSFFPKLKEKVEKMSTTKLIISATPS